MMDSTADAHAGALPYSPLSWPPSLLPPKPIDAYVGACKQPVP